jgi:uncharacterized protein YhaN
MATPSPKKKKKKSGLFRWTNVKKVEALFIVPADGYLALSTVDADRHEKEIARMEVGNPRPNSWILRAVEAAMADRSEQRFRLFRRGLKGAPNGSASFRVSRRADLAAASAMVAPTPPPESGLRIAEVEVERVTEEFARANEDQIQLWERVTGLEEMAEFADKETRDKFQKVSEELAAERAARKALEGRLNGIEAALAAVLPELRLKGDGYVALADLLRRK